MKLFQFRAFFYEKMSNVYPDYERTGIYSILLEKYLGISRIEAALYAHRTIDELALSQLKKAVKRLEKFEPIQYVIGEAYFKGLRLKVTADTLIPRPETEELVDWIIEDYKSVKQPIKAMDIGTGSGCIALALKKEWKESEITAVDISEKALEVAKYNAKSLELSIEFMQMNILDGDLQKENLDFIVSNPPYVREIEKKEMRSNVLDYEPDLALFVANSDPLLFYRNILEVAQKTVKEEGSVYFEINESFALETIELAKRLGWENTRLKKDIFERDRMLRCRR